MSNARTQTSLDWLGGVYTSLLAWWMPKAIILAGLLFPVSVRAVIWIIALPSGGHSVHIEREAVQSHPLPLHWPLLSCDDRTCGSVRHRGRFRRNLWMDFFGRIHCRRQRAHMVGHRADMGQVLLGWEAERSAKSVEVKS